MSGINKVILLGRLTRDPEVKALESGPVCNFSLATSEKWTDKKSGEMKEKAEFHSISVFGTLANLCGQYLKKGRQCYVEGKLETRSYEKDGEKKYVTGIKADKVEFLGSAEKSETTEETPAFAAPKTPLTKPQEVRAVKNYADDIPF